MLITDKSYHIYWFEQVVNYLWYVMEFGRINHMLGQNALLVIYNAK